MSEVQLFCKKDQDFTLGDLNATVNALVNVGNSSTLGGGIGVFGAGLNMEWTVTYDEILFIHDGQFELQVGDVKYQAGPGDVLWIPAGTALIYQAEKDVTFFYAVSPVDNSPSTQNALEFTTTAPVPA
jgi:ethanolamine utilization protein EutQ